MLKPDDDDSYPSGPWDHYVPPEPKEEREPRNDPPLIQHDEYDPLDELPP